MSQSKKAITRSGSPGSNMQLSSFRSLWTNETRCGSRNGWPRAVRGLALIAASWSGICDQVPALLPPLHLAFDEAGRSTEVGEAALAGSSRWKSAIASTRAIADAPPDVAMSAHALRE